MNRVISRIRQKTQAAMVAATCLFAASAQAVVVDWPSASAPCNTTLQACLDGTPGPSLIRIGPSAPITTGMVFVNANQSLTAAPGARPRFRNSQITVYLGGIDTPVSKISIDNLILEESFFYVFVGLDNRVDTESLVLSSLKFVNQTIHPAVFLVPTNPAGTQRSVSIQHSEINAPSALRVARDFPSENLRIDFHDNLVRSNVATSHPAFFWPGMKQNAFLAMSRNRFESTPGLGNFGVMLGTSDSPVEAVPRYALLTENVFVGVDTPIHLNDGGGALQVTARHNSLSRFVDGILVQRGGPGNLQFDLRNNVLANGMQAIRLSPASSSFPELTRSRNLYHGVGTPSIGFESNAVLANPLFQSASNLRVQTGSPAVDQADSSGTDPTYRRDHDGIIGVRGSGLDIGAYEWTNASSSELLTNTSNITGNNVGIPTTMVNPATGAIALFQRVISGDGAPVPTDANLNLGIYQAISHFRLFTQNMAGFPVGSFRILNPGTGSYARDPNFVHRAINEAGNPNNNISWHVTLLPSSQFPLHLGELYQRQPQVVQRWNPPGSFGTYNNHGIGIYQTGNTYGIYNQDIASMPNGAGFHVLTPAAFAHYAFKVDTQTSSAAIPLNHAWLTDNACAHVYVTPTWGSSSGGTAYITSPIMVRFDHTADGGGQWVAVRGDGLNFAAHSALNVYLDPVVARRCREAVF